MTILKASALGSLRCSLNLVEIAEDPTSRNPRCSMSKHRLEAALELAMQFRLEQ